MNLQSLMAGAFLGMLLGQTVNYLVTKGHVAKLVEQAEKHIPEKYQEMIVKLLDEVSREFEEDEDDPQ